MQKDLGQGCRKQGPLRATVGNMTIIDADPIRAGSPVADDETVSIVVLKKQDGTDAAVLVPRSIRNAPPHLLEVYSDLQTTAALIEQAMRDLDATVLEAREMGASWGSIGWSVGISQQAARQRWGLIPDGD